MRWIYKMKEIIIKWKKKGGLGWSEYGNFNIKSLDEAEKFIEEEKKVGADDCDFMIIERTTIDKILKRIYH